MCECVPRLLFAFLQIDSRCRIFAGVDRRGPDANRRYENANEIYSPRARYKSLTFHYFALVLGCVCVCVWLVIY